MEDYIMNSTKIIVIVCSFCLAIIFGGCTKKKSSQDTEFLSSEATTKTTTSSTTTQDIFDEFYKEDNLKKQKENPISKNKELSKSPSSISEEPTFSENGRYVVQVASVPSFSLAEKIRKKLNEKGYPAYIAEVINPTPSLPGTYYRVRIGGFNLTSDAKNFGEKFLVPEGYGYWVDKRSNDSRGGETQTTPTSGAYYSQEESQPKTDYLYYTPTPYSPTNDQNNTNNTSPNNSPTNSNTQAGTNQTSIAPEGSSTSEKPIESTQPQKSQPSQPSQAPPKSNENEWKDEW